MNNDIDYSTCVSAFDGINKAELRDTLSIDNQMDQRRRSSPRLNRRFKVSKEYRA